ncbi:MAG TPA: glucose-6-phosphate isomerase, partial [Atribacterota bacterium]|nr:glucose-6-phosphate isomerase [Atribacterota bacterium]
MKEGEGYLREAYPVWKLLEEHYEKIKKVHLRQLFEDDPQRGEKMVVEDEGIYFDYSKHRITSETLNLLLQLAEQSALQGHIEAMFSGEKINISEDRAVLHIALRSPRGDSIIVDGEDAVVKVHEVLHKMANFASQIRSGQWKGFTGKSIRNVISIGIGGSNLGPEMAYQALRYYSIPEIKFAFLSNIDGTDFYEKVSGLNPEETLFIISSKSFTTPETM